MTSRLDALRSTTRFGRFVSVGIVGAAVDNATLVALRLGAGLSELLAKAGGVETAIVVMFLVNERWTFADHGAAGRRPFLRRLLTSHGVRAGGAAIQLAVYWALTSRLDVTLVVGGTDLWFLAASPLAIAVAVLVNYVAESLFTWRVDAGS
jgi:Predicted membrane protein